MMNFLITLLSIVLINNPASAQIVSLKIPVGFNGFSAKFRTYADGSVSVTDPTIGYRTAYYPLYGSTSTATGWCAIMGKTLVSTPTIIRNPTTGSTLAIDPRTGAASFYASTNIISLFVCR